MSINNLLDSTVLPYEALNVHSIKTENPPEISNYSYIYLGLKNMYGSANVAAGQEFPLIPLDWAISNVYYYNISSVGGSYIEQGVIESPNTTSQYARIEKEGFYEVNYQVNYITNQAITGSTSYPITSVEFFIEKLSGSTTTLLQNSKGFFPSFTAPLSVETIFIPGPLSGSYIGKFLVGDLIFIHGKNNASYGIQWNPENTGATNCENYISIKYLG